MNDDLKQKPESYWKEKLDPERYNVLRQAGTEQPFTGDLLNNHDKGMYVCGACGQELFSSDTKFESGSGWPSFTDPVNREHVDLIEDSTHGMTRTEVVCKRCGSHLGHVFPDGPKQMPDGKPASGQRFCINSASLDFKKSEK